MCFDLYRLHQEKLDLVVKFLEVNIDYAVGQLEGNEWKYEEKYHCSDLRSSDLDNCGKKYLYEI